MELSYLPLINSILNSICTILLLIGFVQIRRGKRQLHQKIMWAAFSVSTIFLISYLIFHYQVGSVPFRGTGWVRPVYFTILISHIILAAAIVPLILLTLSRAVQKKFDLHRKIARITWPLWMYVSVTGVIVYLFMDAFNSYAGI
jgi:uncharacterized membrane protein YozB (DUF420 family)